MVKQIFLASLLFGASLYNPLFGDVDNNIGCSSCVEECDDCCCPEDVCIDSLYLTLRHIDPKGVGYEEGYTTLEALYFPFVENHCFQPFLDVRGHVFNDAEFAANAGIGLRYLDDCCASWGANVYYDYRSDRDRKVHFHQIGAGLEYLTDCFDVRLNGYFPITRKDCFKKLHGEYETDDLKVECCLESVSFIGGNLEVGVPFCFFPYVDFYIAGGPYYYDARKTSKDTWGGQIRLDAFICTNFRVGLIVNHDSIFDTRVQGVVSFTLPLGGKCVTDCGQSCALRRVERNEIIVLNELFDWSWWY
ncbi:MAG: hypothetical protein KR126chlam1_01130 [Chlamydiae bacterium]|nr:hypothetical protein [Chlamydiota bacterium]